MTNKVWKKLENRIVLLLFLVAATLSAVIYYINSNQYYSLWIIILTAVFVCVFIVIVLFMIKKAVRYTEKVFVKLMEDLKAAKEAAEQSNRAKEIFLAKMSHEIRTPLNAILGVSEIQLRNNILSEDVEKGFNTIYESGSLLLNIFNDILDFSKIESEIVKGASGEVSERFRDYSFHNKPALKIAGTKQKQKLDGRVLIVDDVNTNLYVATGLMLPYGLHIETAASGHESIEKIKNNEVYDIVFMDHMMPGMDGIEAVKIIREMGYINPIVAFTANAVAGQAEMFLANGFDAFISKPIDSYELDKILKWYIKSNVLIDNFDVKQNKIDSSKVRKIFLMDAKNAINILNELSAKLDNLNDKELKSYIVAVHGIKTALANIGEKELSGAAYKLEQAGGERNFNLLASETPVFFKTLLRLVEKYKTTEPPTDPAAPDQRFGSSQAEDNIVEIPCEDADFLHERLDEIKKACENFNIKTAKKALAGLMQREWPYAIKNNCDELSVSLLCGEYDKAAAVIEKTMELKYLKIPPAGSQDEVSGYNDEMVIPG